MAAALSAKDLAEKLGTDSKTARRFLRKQGMGVGQGNRYEIDPRSLNRLTKEFKKFQVAEAEKKAKREQEKVKSDKATTKSETVDPVESDTDAEPTDKDLEDIQAEEPETI